MENVLEKVCDEKHKAINDRKNDWRNEVMTNDLNKLHPYVKYLAELLTAECKKQGVIITVTGTLRTNGEQDALYAQGRTRSGSIVTNCRGGQSMHNYGVAFDIAVVLKDGKTLSWANNVDTDKDGKRDYYEAGAIGKSLGLTWGGDFRAIHDMPHFEWTGGLTLKDLQSGKKPFNPLEKAILKQGDKGVSTIELQKALIKKGYNPGIPDGIFGPKTLAAVKSFQGANKLPVDGVVGPMVWARLLI